MRLKGEKIALVTGGSRGIGRAIAIKFAEEGATVVVNYSALADKGAYRDAADRLVRQIEDKGGKAMAYDADVKDQRAVHDMFTRVSEQFGRLDILAVNAGICPFKEFLDISEELWDEVNDVNLKGAFLCTQEAGRLMKKKGTKGRIIFTSSVSSIFGGELQAHYCPTKGGINQLMRSVAIALGKYGITANAVLPGTVETDINRTALRKNQELKRYFIRRTPLGRLGTPEDIALAFVFFASDDASFISGATLIVDGGMSVNLQ